MAIFRHVTDAEQPLHVRIALLRRDGLAFDQDLARTERRGCRRAPREVRTVRCRRRRPRRESRLRAMRTTRRRRERRRGRRAPQDSRASSAIAPGCAGPFSIFRITLRPTIASASSGGDVWAVSKVATISPRRMTDTRSVNDHDLAQLVGDEDDGLVLALEHAQHLEQLVGLGRRQHRRRLVKHEDLGAAHQRLQDLDALLQADRQFADNGVGIDHEAVFAPEFAKALADCACALGRAAARPRRRASRFRGRRAAAPA